MLKSLIRKLYKQDPYYVPVTADIQMQKALANKVYISPLNQNLKVAFEKGKFDFDRSIRKLKRRERKEERQIKDLT